ncbi:MAG: patatin [Chloroflexi bacterium]|nr:MAG: patatin [Chloroflexota bacterium]
MIKKTALILSGGGAKGAFQCGAEKYAREVKGYNWDIIAGVSVGALNGTMLAMEKYQRLFEAWNTISNDQVYTGGFNLISLIRTLFGAKSFYSNRPLEEMLFKELEPEKICKHLLIGAVSLVTGEYVQFKGDDLNLGKAVLASTVMPIIWEPVDVSPLLPSMVDGGVRNISPIGDVLDYEPDELVIINCSSQAAHPIPEPPKDIVKVGLRTMDILLNELFRGDMQDFLRINELVRQAQSQRIVLYNPDSGKPYKYYEYKIIEPDQPLGDTLDFSRDAVQRSLSMGIQRAREVLGR